MWGRRVIHFETRMWYLLPARSNSNLLHSFDGAQGEEWSVSEKERGDSTMGCGSVSTLKESHRG